MYITANSGTAQIIPHIPKSPLPTRIENSTQKLETPVVLPKILGPKIFPSNCCRTIIITTKVIHFIGSTKRINRALGIAPINGPKNGITFVTPTITLTSAP